MQLQDLSHWTSNDSPLRSQVLLAGACFLLVFTACGINFSYGVYQEHYDILGGPFQDATYGNISIIGTLASSVMMLGAPAANYVMKTWGPQAAVMMSAVFFATSGILASGGTSLWHFQLAQGLIQGCAACLAYIPAVTISPRVFDSRRGLALGVITSGTGLGGVMWAPLLRRLLTILGFRLTLVFAGLICATLILFAATAFEEVENLLIHPPTAEQGAEKHEAPLSMATSRLFLAHATASALQSAVYFVPMYFMSSLAHSLQFSEISGANIIALCNLCNCIGKIIIGYVADRLGRLGLLAGTTAFSALASLGLAGMVVMPVALTAQRGLLLLYAIVYGSSAGAYVALLPTALVEQFGLGGFARINSLIYLYRGIGALIGTWVAGLLIGSQRGGKDHLPRDFGFTFIFVGTSLAAAAALVMWARNKGVHRAM